MENIFDISGKTTSSTSPVLIIGGLGSNLRADFELTITNPTATSAEIIISDGGQTAFDHTIGAEAGGIAEPYTFKAPSTNNAVYLTNPAGIVGIEYSFQLTVHD